MLRVQDKLIFSFIAIALLAIGMTIFTLNLESLFLKLGLNILTLIVAYLLARKAILAILKPIQKLMVIPKALKEGNYEVEVKIKEDDEFGRLGECFNQALKTIRETHWALAEEKNLATTRKAYLEEEIRELLKIMNETRHGDLSKEAPVKGEDEIGQLAIHFNQMLQSLRELIGQIKDGGLKITGVAGEVHTTTEQLASSSAELSASVTEVTATMEELSSTAKQIAENVKSVEKVFEDTTEAAQRGSEAVSSAVQGMDNIKDKVEEIAAKVLTLGEKSQQIGVVLELIKEISGEVHLLALNAAIESAAAGEQGKRFGVVASEIRRLAEKTRESAENIRSIVSEIQKGTNASILATEQGAKEVELGVKVVKRVGESLEEIIEMINQTFHASKQISIATQQQRSASDQVVMTMRQISEVAQQTAVGMKQSTKAVGELNRLADEFKEKIKGFRLGQGKESIQEGMERKNGKRF